MYKVESPKKMISLISMLGGRALLAGAQLNHDLLFCLMEQSANQKSIEQTGSYPFANENNNYDYLSLCSHFSGDLHNECLEYMANPSYIKEKSECLSFLDHEDDDQGIKMDEEKVNKWSEFVNYMFDYKKIYETDRDLYYRFQVFHDNLEWIVEHNQDPEHTYQVGINHFADYTHQEYKEFVKRGSGYVDGRALRGSFMGITCSALPAYSGSLPTSFDWVSKGAVDKILDQGSCGSCYTFSTVSALNALYFQKYGKLVPLSEQQLIDCSYGFPYGNFGCNGGLMDKCFSYVHDNGIVAAADYPYTAAKGSCKAAQYKAALPTISTCYDVATNEYDVTYAITKNVLSIAIQADGRSFQLYKSGVYNDATCYQGSLDHGVALVSYSHDSTSGLDYYLLRNQWGTTWGEAGNMRIARNTSKSSTTGICGLALSASFPVA